MLETRPRNERWWIINKPIIKEEEGRIIASSQKEYIKIWQARNKLKTRINSTKWYKKKSADPVYREERRKYEAERRKKIVYKKNQKKSIQNMQKSQDAKNKEIDSDDDSFSYATTHIFTAPPLGGTAEIKYPPEFEYLAPNEQGQVKKLFVDLRQGKRYPVVAGGFGDMIYCDGIVESVTDPPEGGRLTKFWGCSYYFKGYPEQPIVQNLGLSKAFFSQLPQFILIKSWYWMVALALRYIFFRKSLIYELRTLFVTAYQNTVEKINLPDDKYNTVTREMGRVADECVRRMLDKVGDNNDLPYSITYFHLLLHHQWHKRSKREMVEIIHAIHKLLRFYLEYDNAYRFRFQDVIIQINKEDVEKNVTKEVRRIFDILIERESEQYSKHVKDKWVMLKKGITLFLSINKEVREFVKDYLLELDLKKLKMDDNDYYFTLRRRTYNFRGETVEERVKEADEIDKQRGHIRMMLTTVKEPQTGRIIASVRVTR